MGISDNVLYVVIAVCACLVVTIIVIVILLVIYCKRKKDGSASGEEAYQVKGQPPTRPLTYENVHVNAGFQLHETPALDKQSIEDMYAKPDKTLKCSTLPATTTILQNDGVLEAADTEQVSDTSEGFVEVPLYDDVPADGHCNPHLIQTLDNTRAEVYENTDAERPQPSEIGDTHREPSNDIMYDDIVGATKPPSQSNDSNQSVPSTDCPKGSSQNAKCPDGSSQGRTIDLNEVPSQPERTNGCVSRDNCPITEVYRVKPKNSGGDVTKQSDVYMIENDLYIEGNHVPLSN